MCALYYTLPPSRVSFVDVHLVVCACPVMCVSLPLSLSLSLSRGPSDQAGVPPPQQTSANARNQAAVSSHSHSRNPRVSHTKCFNSMHTYTHTHTHAHVHRLIRRADDTKEKVTTRLATYYSHLAGIASELVRSTLPIACAIHSHTITQLSLSFSLSITIHSTHTQSPNPPFHLLPPMQSTLTQPHTNSLSHSISPLGPAGDALSTGEIHSVCVCMYACVCVCVCVVIRNRHS
jgi:hypothetical protein